MGIGAGAPASRSGELHVLRQIALRPGPLCCFDVGANTGQFAELALSVLPVERTTIHCFEPAAQAFEMLRERLLPFPHVRLNRHAVGARSGTATLYADASGSSLGSLTQRDVSHCGIAFQHAEQVQIRTLDEYCAQLGISQINLLKLDVEGHELEALQGSEALLAAGRIDMITFEFGGCNIDTRTFFRDFWRFFQRQGMKLSRITPSGYLVPLREYEESLEQFRASNYVAER